MESSGTNFADDVLHRVPASSVDGPPDDESPGLPYDLPYELPYGLSGRVADLVPGEFIAAGDRAVAGFAAADSAADSAAADLVPSSSTAVAAETFGDLIVGSAAGLGDIDLPRSLVSRNSVKIRPSFEGLGSCHDHSSPGSACGQLRSCEPVDPS